VLKDYKGRAAIAQGEDFDTSPAHIEHRTTRGALPNGMRYALLPKENRGDAVNALFTFRFGTLESLQNQSVAAQLAGAMLNRGTVNKTRQQLNEAQDKLKARIGIAGEVDSLTVSMETDRANLPDTIRLAAEMLRQSSFPTNEFEKLREEWLANLEQQKSDPGALARNALARITNPRPKSDPRYTMTCDEEVEALKAVTLEQVKAFAAKFHGGSDATGAVVGDFDAGEIVAALRESFGDWKSPSPYKRIENPYQPVGASVTVIETPDKANAVFLAALGFPMRNDHPDYPALTVGGFAIGGGFLNSRLAVRIRQKEGLSYGVGGRFYAGMLDENGGFTASAIYNPVNVEKLEAAFREEIERAAKDGLSAEEFATAQSGLLKSRKVGRSSDSGLASALAQYLMMDRTFLWDAELEAAVEKLTVEKVNATLKKYLDYSKMTIVKAGDFKKAAAKE
jgi:zinc protease